MSTYSNISTSSNNEENSPTASAYTKIRGRPPIKSNYEQNSIKETTPVNDNFTSEEDSDDISDTDEEDEDHEISRKKICTPKHVTLIPINKETSNSFGNIIFFVVIITAVGILSYAFSHHENPQIFNARQISVSELRDSVRNLQNIFQNQNPKIWNTILSQVEEVMKASEKIAIINLLGSESNTVNCLAEKLSNAIDKIFHNNDKHHTLTPKTIGKNHEVLIQELKGVLQKRKTVLVKDLLNIEPGSILTFQYLCDRENPLVANVTYIITSILDDSLQNEIAFENHITERYSNAIKYDILSPLVTRIMDGPVIPIKSEPGIREC